MPMVPMAIAYSNRDKNIEVWRKQVESGWIDQAYRTITLTEPATGEFLTWLQKNAVKQ